MICGGGAQSAMWCQLISDTTGKIVHTPSGREFGALGVSMIAALATGIYKNIATAAERAVSVASSFQPNRNNHQIYRELYHLYKNLYQHIWDDWDLRAVILKRIKSIEPNK